MLVVMIVETPLVSGKNTIFDNSQGLNDSEIEVMIGTWCCLTRISLVNKF